MKKIIPILLSMFLVVFVSCKNDTEKTETNEVDSSSIKENTVQKTDIKVEIDTVEAQQMISIRSKVGMSEIGPEMGKLYGELMTYATEKGYKIVGAPVAIYHEWSYTDSDFECGLIVSGDLEGTDRIIVSETYSGRVVTAMHYGSYMSVTKTWTAVMNYVKQNNLEENGLPWETYITDPATEPDTNKWETRIYQPVK